MTQFPARCLTVCVLAAAIGGFTRSADSQMALPSSSNALYERGVQAYFAGRSSEAEMYLSQALKANPNDPRYYYFRALSLMRLGRTNEARGDMMVGAEVEALAGGRYPVGASLEFVQGANRLQLERYRRPALDAIASRRPAPQPQRKRPIEVTSYTGDAAMLRRRILVPLERFVGGPPRAGGPTAAPHDYSQPRNTADDPFRDDVQTMSLNPARAAQPTESERALEADDDPFRER
jgi:tetratricopeptide (TPR) repeat protein